MTPASAASSSVRAWPAAATSGSRRRRRGRDEEDDVGDAGLEPLGEGLVGPRRLGGRVLETAGRQVLGDAAAERAGHQDEEDGGDDDRHERRADRWASRVSMRGSPSET